MNRRIWGLIYRHICMYRRSWPRVVEIAYWPTLNMLIWGFTSSYIAHAHAGPRALAAGALIGGVLLWEITLRSQMGVTIGFLEEIWSRNLGHLFVSPLRPAELIGALLAVSAIRTSGRGSNFDQKPSSKQASAGTMVSQFRKDRLPLTMRVI